MPDIKISALPAATALAGTELVPVVQGGVTSRTTAAGLVSQLSTAANFKGVTVGSTGITMATGALFMGTGNVDVVGGHIQTGTGFPIISGGAFGCNGKTEQTSVTVNAASVDLATVVALCNQLRAALIANGICQ